jgi:hypothetical protein
MEMQVLLNRLGGSLFCQALFQDSVKPSRDEFNLIRLFVEEFCWEHTIDFVERDFVGYYEVRPLDRIVCGLWPVNYIEVVFWLLYCSVVVFDAPEFNNTMRWIEDVGNYSRHIDIGKWRHACGELRRFVQRTVFA